MIEDTDIVKRLRAVGAEGSILQRAADEIERLRAEPDVACFIEQDEKIKEMDAEICRLRRLIVAAFYDPNPELILEREVRGID